MGANAQNSVPAFTAGQVLTAAQVTQINTGIPVFASSTERDAAFDGTGEKTLAEGQYAFLEDVNETQVYDGSSWDAVGGGGLVYITSASFSAVASVSAATSTFSATYDHYKIVVDLSAVSTNLSVLLRWRASGVDTTSGNYYSMANTCNSAGTASTFAVSGGTSHKIGTLNPTGGYAGGLSFDVIGPNVAVPTTHHGQSVDGGSAIVSNFGGTINLSTQYDAFTLLTSTGTMTGTYFVYGYAKA